MKRLSSMFLAMFVTVSFLLLPLGAQSAGFGPCVLSAPVAIDGDTLRADVNIWPGITMDAAIRVARLYVRPRE